MGKEYVTVGEGLRQVLWGELLALISLVASDVGRGLQVTPLVWLGGLVGIVGMTMVIFGLAGASSVQSGYRKAVFCVWAELLLSVASGFLPDMWKAVITLLSALCASAGVWFVCASTCDIPLEQEGTVRSGGAVWKVYAVGSILSAAAYALFVYTHWFPGVRFPVMLAAAILQVVVLFVYLRFLDQNQHLLRGK